MQAKDAATAADLDDDLGMTAAFADLNDCRALAFGLGDGIADVFAHAGLLRAVNGHAIKFHLLELEPGGLGLCWDTH